MCQCWRAKGYGYNRSPDKHGTVPVYDLNSGNLITLPRNKIRVASDLSDGGETFEPVQMPRFGNVYIWADSHGQDARNYSIVNRDAQDLTGKSYLAMLRYRKLGVAASVKRIAGSSKNRTLFIGPVEAT